MQTIGTMHGSKREKPISASFTNRKRVKKDIHGRPLVDRKKIKSREMTPFTAYQQRKKQNTDFLKGRKINRLWPDNNRSAYRHRLLNQKEFDHYKKMIEIEGQKDLQKNPVLRESQKVTRSRKVRRKAESARNQDLHERIRRRVQKDVNLQT